MADQAKITHLLRRTEYVVKPARLRALSKKSVTLAEAVDDVLNFTLNPGDVPTFDPENWESRDELIRWWISRMVHVPRPFQEKLTFFWHGHFVSSFEKCDYQSMVDQNRLFRKFAIGDFRVMTQKMALQPAMLFYLDNLSNSRYSPNQNFARELMELFTLGITNPDNNNKPNYTEPDVEAAAAAWTGHGYNWDTGKYEFHEWDHDPEPKTFFGTTKNWDGPDIIDELLRDNPKKRLLAARFITRKLWSYLAYPIPNGPNPPFIVELSNIFIASGMKIRPLVRAMLLRDEFYSTAARQGLVRTPTEYMAALHHHTRIPLDEFVWSWDMDGTGQVPFYPPNVAGWKSNGYWINTTAVSARAGTAQRIADRLVGWNSDRNEPRPLGEFMRASTPQQIYDRVAPMFYRDHTTEISLATKKAIMSYMNSHKTATDEQEPDEWRFPFYVIGMFLMAPEFHMA